MASKPRIPFVGPQQDPQPDDFVTALLTASRVLVGVSARSLTVVEDTVTLAQFRALVVLDSHGVMNLNRLADLLAVNSSTAMRMIDRLLAAGMVTRQENPSNRREVLLGVSRRGATVVKKVTDRRRRDIAGIVEAIPSHQRSSLIEALRAFADAAGEPSATGERDSTAMW